MVALLYTLGMATEETPRTQLDDLEDLLEENLRVAKDNHKMLKAMRREALVAGLVKTVLWLGAIGLSVYFTLQYLGPLLGPASEAASSFRPEDYQALFDFYKGQMGQ